MIFMPTVNPGYVMYFRPVKVQVFCLLLSKTSFLTNSTNLVLFLIPIKEIHASLPGRHLLVSRQQEILHQCLKSLQC